LTLGDCIDRGPESRGVLDLITGLGCRCQLVPLLGNRDEMLLGLATYLHPHYWQIGMDSYATPDSHDRARRLGLNTDDHFAFLEGWLDYHDIASHLFVHVDDEPNLPMDGQP